MDLIKVADLLIGKIKRDYINDVAIVALCGSYIYGDTHQKSDLDFYFIPKTKRGYEMSQCFILEDIGFDFWGMPWERAESLAKYNETNTSIISKAKVIYWASQADLDRFDALRNMGQDIPKKEFSQKAFEQVSVCQDFYFKMLESKNHFSLVKQNAICILYYSAFSIALLNGSYIERGGRNLLNEVLSMKMYPKDFRDLYEKVIHSNCVEEIIASSQSVVMNLRDLIQSQREYSKVSISQGYYEELKSIYNKLLHECETDNRQGIMLAIARLNLDVSQLLNQSNHSYAKFPDLFSLSQRCNSDELIQAVQTHERMLVEILHEENISIIRYQNLDEFRAHLNM